MDTIQVFRDATYNFFVSDYEGNGFPSGHYAVFYGDSVDYSKLLLFGDANFTSNVTETFVASEKHIILEWEDPSKNLTNIPGAGGVEETALNSTGASNLTEISEVTDSIVQETLSNSTGASNLTEISEVTDSVVQETLSNSTDALGNSSFNSAQAINQDAVDGDYWG